MKASKFALLAFLCTLSLAPDLSAQEPQHHHDADEELGAVYFSTSCAPAVQSQFDRGVALLHSFEYEVADTQFEEVTKKDPRCAMAYWGQAMTLYHELWNRPSKADLAQGAELLAKARSLKPPTARERDYVLALSVFYDDWTDKLDHNQRADATAEAMQGGLRTQSQTTTKPPSFTRSRFSASGPDLRPQSHQRQSAGRCHPQQALRRATKSSGHRALHHPQCCDNPAMASLALPAARKYASIAPSSPHAVHMPSHIFARLGLWRDDINSPNLAAIRVADSIGCTSSRDASQSAFLGLPRIRVHANRRRRQRWSQGDHRADRSDSP